MFYYMACQRLRLAPSNFLPEFLFWTKNGKSVTSFTFKAGKDGRHTRVWFAPPLEGRITLAGNASTQNRVEKITKSPVFRGMIIQVISVFQQFFHRTLSSQASLLLASCEQGNTMLFLANSFAVYLYTAHIFTPLFTCSEEKPWFFEHSHLYSPEIQK